MTTFLVNFEFEEYEGTRICNKNIDLKLGLGTMIKLLYEFEIRDSS